MLKQVWQVLGRLPGEMSSSDWLVSGETNVLNGKPFIFLVNLSATPVAEQIRKNVYIFTMKAWFLNARLVNL